MNENPHQTPADARDAADSTRNTPGDAERASVAGNATTGKAAIPGDAVPESVGSATVAEAGNQSQSDDRANVHAEALELGVKLELLRWAIDRESARKANAFMERLARVKLERKKRRALDRLVGRFERKPRRKL